jgi:saccharopine dehydrogenase (NAD+, L-lysine forming)
MKRLGIMKETKNRWERRVPLNPDAVRQLVEKGYEVYVQPSDIRIYTNEEYEDVGATLQDDLSTCDLIVGVKEIPSEHILSEIPHLFFSHTIKGQSHNMPMLRDILRKNATLIDYERIVDEEGRRLVFFGQYAGYAGTIDTLWALGQRLKARKGIETPFLKLKRAYEYETVEDAVTHLREIGAEIEKKGLPKEIAPLNIFVLGYGHVAQGCMHILSALPVIEAEPDELATLAQGYRTNKVYVTVFKEKHLVERKDGEPFNLRNYYNHGGEYRSRMKYYLPYCSVYLNAIFWAPGYPVFLKNRDMEAMQGPDQKLIAIGDITCDIDGSVQATVKSTEPDNPVFIYNALTGEATDGLEGEGFADMAVDNLPCEFSKEASNYFTTALLPYIEAMLTNDYRKPIKDSILPEPIRRAVLVHHGKLEHDYKFMYQFIEE